jgi:hypothetical protein
MNNSNNKVLYCDDGKSTRSNATYVNVGKGILPEKSADSIGYEIDLISRTDGRTDDNLNEVNEFHTGIILNAPRGFHYEVYGTPELWKSGYLLPSGMMVVQNDVELVVPLIKFTDKVPDLECGNFRGVNVILRENVYAHITAEVRQQPQVPIYYVPQMMPPNQQGYFMPQMQQPVPDVRNVRAPPSRRTGNTMM